jgi:hypothetical protein
MSSAIIAAEWGSVMRIYCCLMLLLAAATIAHAQMEPCLTGADSPGCGIKITMNPPLSGNLLSAPNEITVDVPMRIRAAKVALLSGPSGSGTGDQFKPVVEAKNFKKVDGNARFKMQVKDCSGTADAFEIAIYSPRFPYPLVVNQQPFQCKQSSAK